MISTNKSNVEFEVETGSHEAFIDVTGLVSEAVSQSGVCDGVCVVYVPHTTCAVTVNENADPDVQADILASLRSQVGDVGFTHVEGNSAAHVKSSLFGCSQSFLVEGGRLVLGRWQGIFLCEFDGPRRRRLLVKVLGV